MVNCLGAVLQQYVIVATVLEKGEETRPNRPKYRYTFPLGKKKYNHISGEIP